MSGRSGSNGPPSRGGLFNLSSRGRNAGGQASMAGITQSMRTLRVSAGSEAKDDATKKQDQEQRKAVRKAKKALAEAKRAERQKNYEKWDEASLKLAAYPSTRPIARDPNKIKANFFEISFQPGKKYRRYRIELGQINNEEPFKKDLRRKLITYLFAKHPPNATAWASDYFSTIITVGRLYSSWNEANPFVRLHPTCNSPGPNDVDLQSNIISEGEFDLKNLDQLILSHERPASYHPDQDINALNIIALRDVNDPSWNGIRVNNKFFPLGAPRWNLVRKVDVGGKGERRQEVHTVYQAKTGFFTSIRPGESKLLLNVNTITGAFYATEISLQEWIRARYNLEPGQIPLQGCCRDIKGLKVTFELLNPTKQWSIYAVSDKSISYEGFEQAIGSPAISVFDYMRQKYTNTTFNPNAICVNLGGPGRDVWHPADKLRIVPYQYVVKTLGSHFADQMVKSAERRPLDNENAILGHALRPLGIEPSKPFWNNFGLRVAAKQLIQMSPRYLRQPTIQFGNATTDLAATNTGDSLAFWDLTAKTFYNPAKGAYQLKIIRITQEDLKDKQGKYHGPSRSDVTSFGAHLLKQLSSYNVEFSGVADIEDVEASRGSPPANRRNQWTQRLERAWGQLGKPKFVLISLASENATIFSDIKYWCDCIKGLPSVCVKPKAIEKDRSHANIFYGDRRLLGNVCMKVNFKLGGINQIVQQVNGSWMCGVFPGTMVVGADVTHSGKASDSTIPSIAAVVATMDDHSGRYLGSARLQAHNTEFIEDLAGMIEERVLRFIESFKPDPKGGALRGPKHILFYRDGVSESQYGMVYDEELSQIERGAEAAGKKRGITVRPAVTLIVVGKRHHTRFFPTYRPGNKPEAGKNFYLQSHDSPIGTARSGHYVVIKNGSNYSLEQLQEITHKLCFTGSRATVSLSVCTPARYADILCDRLRNYMRPVLESEIDDIPGKTVDQYNQDPVSWRGVNFVSNVTNQPRVNPWNPKLDDTMFYL
ncbi:hypothetical protein EG329_001355 [Mollisiaceae sp. DMI_Dod_QoI]|nr:hypothetical protein EG329_001355 [Helotiales sp. DMI_Dod_QoI]